MIQRLRLQIEVYRTIAKEHSDLQISVIYRVIANELERILDEVDTNE